jgi:hypothetical protein
MQQQCKQESKASPKRWETLLLNIAGRPIVLKYMVSTCAARIPCYGENGATVHPQGLSVIKTAPGDTLIDIRYLSRQMFEQ